MIIDLKNHSTKKQFLIFFQNHFKEMYSLNYDALIDVLTAYDSFLEIKLLNFSSFEDTKNLKEIIEIIQMENKNIQFTYLQ